MNHTLEHTYILSIKLETLLQRQYIEVNIF